MSFFYFLKYVWVDENSWLYVCGDQNSWLYAYTYVLTYIRMFLRIYVCTYVCVDENSWLYVCMYIHITSKLNHLCHILPPRRCVYFVFLRPIKIYFTSEDILFITSSPLCLLRVFTCFYVLKSLLHEWGHNVYYILAVVFASCFYILFKFRFMREATPGGTLLTSLK